MQKETQRNSAAGKSPARANPQRKLTRAEKKQIAEVIRQAKGDGKAHTAQQTIPYLQMYPDGICKVTEKKYSKTVAFEDINYQLAQADDKTAIFENWCDFLNYFDASVSVQLSFINQGTQRGETEKAIDIPAQEDAFNSIRSEYADMLKNQLSKGNNGLVKAKYITFAIEADSLAAAKSRLARIETDVLNNFKLLGVSARPMTGYERLKMLHGIFHPEGEPFRFDFLPPTSWKQAKQSKRRAVLSMHQLTGDFYTVGEVLGHTLAGIGVSLGLSMNFEAVTARYVDVRLERKKEVLDAYHGAVKQADPAKAEKAEPKKAKSAAKKKSSDLEL